MYDVLIIGPQGSGKGTQAEHLAAKLGVPLVSVGHLFRAEIDKTTGLGSEMSSYIAKGERVPPAIVDQLMRGRLHEEDAVNGVLLDGYPRTVEQKGTLEKILGELGRKLTHVIYLNISDDEAILRLSGRLVCSNLKCETNYHITFNKPTNPDICDKCGSPLIQRKDDTPDAIKRRLELYHADTQQLIAYYQQLGILHEINGALPIAEVEAAINAALGV